MSEEFVSVPRGLAQELDDLLYILTGHDSHPKMIRKYGEEFWLKLDELRNPLCKALSAPPQPDHSAQPVGWQFFHDGKWWNGDDRIKDHRKNTIDAGYLVRDVYAQPLDTVQLVSYAEDMSTCTLTNGDGNGYFYDRIKHVDTTQIKAWLVSGNADNTSAYVNDPRGWAHGYTVEPLYTHADAGQVEQLKNQLSAWMALAAERLDMLAEAKRLLNNARPRVYEQGLNGEIKAFLAASAKPKVAPSEDVRSVGDEPVAYMCQDDSAHDNLVKCTFTDLGAFGVYRRPQRPVVLPERKDPDSAMSEPYDPDSWNACLDAVEALNK